MIRRFFVYLALSPLIALVVAVCLGYTASYPIAKSWITPNGVGVYESRTWGATLHFNSDLMGRYGPAAQLNASREGMRWSALVSNSKLDQRPWVAVEQAWGWPQRIARGHYLETDPVAVTTPPNLIIPQDHYGNAFALHRIVPLTPIWPGLLVNTLFYAAITALLHLTFTTTRRAIRRRRHRCPHCGYDTHGLTTPTCPECGHDTKRLF